MCVLRAGGTEFDVDAFLAASTLQPCAVFRRGEPRFRSKPDGRVRERSGINVPVSDASWSDLPAQVADAERFLEANGAELARLAAWPGGSGVTLDFPVDEPDRPGPVTFKFPSAFVSAAAALGIELELSFYPPGPD